VQGHRPRVGNRIHLSLDAIPFVSSSTSFMTSSFVGRTGNPMPVYYATNDSEDVLG